VLSVFMMILTDSPKPERLDGEMQIG